MTDDAALARALEEQARRSRVMAEAQRFGPPHHPEGGDTDPGDTRTEGHERPVGGSATSDDQAD